MKYHPKIVLIFVLIFYIIDVVYADNSDKATMDDIIDSLTITIVFDNYPFAEGLETGWGFSCLVEADGHKLLFDTGEDGAMLMHNLSGLDIDPKAIEFVMLSHDHWDHTKGLPAFLDKNRKVGVLVLSAFSWGTKNEITKRRATLREIDEPIEIFPGALTTGKMGTDIPEHSLILKTNRGTIVITGCAHPGIVNIVERAKELSGMEIFLVMGGFHLMAMSETGVLQITEDFKRLGVRYVAPTHCTGDHAIRIFNERFGDNCLRLGSGQIIRPGELK